LQHFSCISEITNVAETENRDDLLTRKHRVDVVFVLHVLCDDLRASLTKAESEQATNFNQCLLKHLRLKHFPLPGLTKTFSFLFKRQLLVLFFSGGF
jgi:hypothetical protein